MLINIETTLIHHPIPPVYNDDSKILILGSFPSVKSREANFFMGIHRIDFGKYSLVFMGVMS